mmetsp:Transcript_73211/g.202898  ORF Transcript_73211/g.202898 Transcript_73211/m.202898 type:complete len:205 (-) Transcript_73211:146-760(-)
MMMPAMDMTTRKVKARITLSVYSRRMKREMSLSARLRFSSMARTFSLTRPICCVCATILVATALPTSCVCATICAVRCSDSVVFSAVPAAPRSSPSVVSGVFSSPRPWLPFISSPRSVMAPSNLSILCSALYSSSCFLSLTLNLARLSSGMALISFLNDLSTSLTRSLSRWHDSKSPPLASASASLSCSMLFLRRLRSFLSLES